LVDQHRAGMYWQDLEDCGAPQHQPDRHRLQEPCNHEEDRQDVDEPKRSERLDICPEISLKRCGCAIFGGHAWRLEGELDRQPENVEIEEVHDLAIDIA